MSLHGRIYRNTTQLKKHERSALITRGIYTEGKRFQFVAEDSVKYADALIEEFQKKRDA
jgi:hypothetical protein